MIPFFLNSSHLRFNTWSNSFFGADFRYFNSIHYYAVTSAFSVVLDPETHPKNTGDGSLLIGPHSALFLAENVISGSHSFFLGRIFSTLTGNSLGKYRRRIPFMWILFHTFTGAEMLFLEARTF